MLVLDIQNDSNNISNHTPNPPRLSSRPLPQTENFKSSTSTKFYST